MRLAWIALLCGCAAAPRPAIAPAGLGDLPLALGGARRAALAGEVTVSHVCVRDRAGLAIDRDVVLRLTEDRPTVIAGAGIATRGGPTPTLRVEARGTSVVWLLLDLAAGPLRIEGDLGDRPLRIRATGPEDAFHLHLGAIRSGGLAYHVVPNGHVHVEGALTGSGGLAGWGSGRSPPPDFEPPECGEPQRQRPRIRAIQRRSSNW